MNDYSCKKHGLLEDKDKHAYKESIICKICRKENKTRWNTENREKSRESSRKCYKKNSKDYISRQGLRSYPILQDFSKEEWRSVEGYEDYYSISSFGRIRSEKRLIEKITGPAILKEKLLKVCARKDGQCFINLWKDGVMESFSVPRLVIQAFFRFPKDHERVIHIDKNPLNNRLDNLFYEEMIYFDSLTKCQETILSDELITVKSIRKKTTASITTAIKYRERLNNNLGN